MIEVYQSLFDGLIIGDPTELYWAGGILVNQPEFLTGLAGHAAADLADEIAQPNGGNLQTLVDEALYWSIRSYEYSDLEFDARMVILAVKTCGFNRKWLASLVDPTKAVIDCLIQPESRAERKVLKQRGQQAMGALGLRHSLRLSREYKKLFDQV